jgi:hypothetical protein
MSGDWTIEYKMKVRVFMAEHGEPVAVEEKRYEWEQDDEVSTYGWVDYDAKRHCKPVEKWDGDGCQWVVPQGARLYERTYSMFMDTFSDNKDQVGINVTGCRCVCGKYTDTILRYEGGLADIMRAITGAPARAEVVL